MKVAGNVLVVLIAIVLLSAPASAQEAQAQAAPKPAIGKPLAQDTAATKKAEATQKAAATKKTSEATKKAVAPRKVPAGLLRLTKDYDIWLDLKRKMVVVDGEVCLRDGQLEMFICTRGTKEHESVISLNCRSQDVHGGLLALGAKNGHPVQFDPKYVPAKGPVVDILILWKNRKGEHQLARGQDWVKDLRTGKTLQHDWVFGGSGFWVDEDTGQRYYQANGGELVCVSNFPSATMDLPIKSSQANTELLYGANTARIPTMGTKVRVLFIPRLPKKKPGEKPTADAKRPAAQFDTRKELRRRSPSSIPASAAKSPRK